MDAWYKLTQYLLDHLPDDIPYDDLAQLCVGLHMHADGVPARRHPLLNGDEQASAFAELVQQRFNDDYGRFDWARYGARMHRPTEKGHWVEVIASIYKDGDTFEPEREREIRARYLADEDDTSSQNAPDAYAFFMLFAFIPVAAGYFLGGVPFFWKHAEHRYALWIAAFVNTLVVPFIVFLARNPRETARTFAVISMICYALGLCFAIYLQIVGESVF
jgi:hypothetical protein